MWTRKLVIENLSLTGKRVLMRVDYNVPKENGRITNNTKIISSLDSIVYALVKEAKSVVITSHLGRPKGIKNMKYSLAPVAEELDLLLKKVHNNPKSLNKNSQMFKLYSGSHHTPSVTFLSDCIGSEIEEVCKDPPQGSIYLLENLQFHLEEKGYGKDASGNIVFSSAEEIKLFRDSLCNLADVYINEAFSLSHKPYSSILGNGFEKRAAGLMFNKEIKYFTKAFYKPHKQYLAIIGGITIVEKYSIIDNLLDKVSDMIIAGAMAFPFLSKLKRMKTGHSMFDVEGSKMVNMIMKKARQNRVKVHFPVDFIASSKLGALQIETIKSGINKGWMGLDIGPETCSIFQRIIMRARMILWNGPPGAYELEHFRTGTQCVLLDVAKATSKGTISILVGGDTAACAAIWQQEDNISHISAGEEAAKFILKGKIPPGIASLSDIKNEQFPIQSKIIV